MNMDYWHEIIKDYDNVEVKGSKKYIYSESTAAIILLILAFGKDHAYNIAVLFQEWASLNELPRASVLKDPSKMSVMLKKMNDDDFIILDGVTVVNGRERKIYTINPRIIQSPVVSPPYKRADGTVLEIPIILVEKFLTWLSESGKHSSIKEQFTETLHNLEKFDYLTFLSFIKEIALQWEEKPEFVSEFPSGPKLSPLIKEYIQEVKLHSDQYIKLFEYILDELERIGFPKDERTIIIEDGKIRVSKRKPTE